MAFSRDRVHVLLSLDTDKTDISDLGPEVVKGGDYPQAWTRKFGKGRSFYTSLGHRDDIWSTDDRCSARTSPAASAGRWGWRTRTDDQRWLGGASIPSTIRAFPSWAAEQPYNCSCVRFRRIIAVHGRVQVVGSSTRIS